MPASAGSKIFDPWPPNNALWKNMKKYGSQIGKKRFINPNPNWPSFLSFNYWWYRIKHQQSDIDKIYLYLKHPLKSKYQLLINGREKIGIKNLKNPKAFIDYSQTIDDVYENLESYYPAEEKRVLIAFDDMIADMESNKKLCPNRGKYVLRCFPFLLGFNIKIGT